MMEAASSFMSMLIAIEVAAAEPFLSFWSNNRSPPAD